MAICKRNHYADRLRHPFLLRSKVIHLHLRCFEAQALGSCVTAQVTARLQTLAAATPGLIAYCRRSPSLLVPIVAGSWPRTQSERRLATIARHVKHETSIDVLTIPTRRLHDQNLLTIEKILPRRRNLLSHATLTEYTDSPKQNTTNINQPSTDHVSTDVAHQHTGRRIFHGRP